MVTAWLVLTTTLAVGFLTVGVESAAGSDVPIPPAEPERRFEVGPPSPADRYPSVSHGGLVWSLTGARVIPRNPDDRLSSPVIAVDVIVANTTPAATLRVREADVRLRWTDGRVDGLTRFDHASSSTGFALQPGETASVTAVFKPTIHVDPTVEELAIELGERGRIPSLLPLSGEVPDTGFPIEALISAEPGILPEPDQPDRQLVISPRTAVIDLESGPFRAAVGDRVGVVVVSVQRAAVTAESAHLQADFWSLLADGEPTSPVRVSRTASPASNEDEVTLVFVLDDEVERLTLLAGAESADPLRYPITVPAGGADGGSVRRSIILD